MLGLGRALGETMAVTFVIGNAHRLGASLFGAGQHDRLGARATNSPRPAGGLYTPSLIALGLILFVHHLHRAGAARSCCCCACAQAKGSTT
jgi:phosphate transport system permease protein